jgi:hypothetical protein
MSGTKQNKINIENNIIEDFVKLCNKKGSIKKALLNILQKYDIDINYSNAMILSIMANRDNKNYRRIVLLVKMGADPNLIMDNDLIIHDLSNLQKLRLDAVFKSLGYKCKWRSVIENKYIDMEKMSNLTPNIDEIYLE